MLCPFDVRHLTPTFLCVGIISCALYSVKSGISDRERGTLGKSQAWGMHYPDSEEVRLSYETEERFPAM